MAIGQVFHLTPLVENLDAALARYEQVFAPLVWYRGYEPDLNNREAALMAISDFCIEPMRPVAPWKPGQSPTSHYRYRERFGDGIHSLAVYSDDIGAIWRGLEGVGVRVTDGGIEGAAFTHPKDFPGLIEFFVAPRADAGTLRDPRLGPDWTSTYWRDIHHLGIEFVSHVTLVVHDHAAAAEMYVKALGVDELPDQDGRTVSSASSFVTFGPETMIELAQPAADSAPGTHLARVGQAWWGATFKVRSIEAVSAFLSGPQVGVPHTVDGHTVRIDPEWFFGVEFAFTERALDGDPRA